MPRRGENIRKRTDGRWEARIRIPNTENGKVSVKSVYAKTYADVREKARVYRNMMQTAAAAGKKEEIRYFGDIADLWLEKIRETRKYSTYVKYQRVYEGYLADDFAKENVQMITGKLVMEGIKRKISDGKHPSNSLLCSINSVLNQILQYGKTYQGISCERIILDKEKPQLSKIEILNTLEQSRLIETLYTDMDIHKLGILICMSTGLRLGEICALKWENISLDEKMIRVTNTVQRIQMETSTSKTILMVSEPKSSFSRREIPISDEMVRLLGEFHQDETYFLNGKYPMEPRTLQNFFARMTKTANIRKVNFHILRHTFATNCINNGADVKSLSELLGHSDVKITLNRYIHPTIETKRSHINSLAAVYGQMRGRAAEQIQYVQEKK